MNSEFEEVDEVDETESECLFDLLLFFFCFNVFEGRKKKEEERRVGARLVRGAKGFLPFECADSVEEEEPELGRLKWNND